MEASLADGTLHPRTAKVDVAKRIVSIYHGQEAADESFAEFERVFVRKDIPDVIDDAVVDGTSLDIVTLLSVTSMVASKSEARRLIQQGGVSIDSVKITDATAIIDLATPVILRVGKLRFLRVHGR